MPDDAVTKNDNGIEIKYTPKGVSVNATTAGGMIGLRFFTDFGKSVKGIRARYNIPETDWPKSKIKWLFDGSIYGVEFWK